ncbi:hypothetical protein J5287_21875 [Rhizobium sp. K1/93]|nr:MULTISPECIES: hypothetical protein [unclassified Rhizobium]MBO9102159.1 hypothetical protein [Rhizobium sp. L58/93]MBO9171909.1 hypothetical protein [Rhizobium sp. L245/93]MBO9186432.1 hypothetical protein [Rhizobium sp. E27B/91]QXZ87213.1 hypothetical protein J5287_21875 [Rhizobium sp. K1/93]QXZ92754.1 hypothetical protein J5280_19020 [Rhizobium sp. K15/93]
MVDAKRGIAFEGLAPVSPECVDPLIGMEAPDCIGPFLRQMLSVSLPHLAPETPIIPPNSGLIDIKIGRYRIEIADQNGEGPQLQHVVGVGLKTLEPFELVVEFKSRHRIVLGMI